MLTLKTSKHRCQCYPQSGSFLYGLRRDAPSTERVLLERLVNILSRAAAHKSKNPQRLWAETERPEWWTKVTKLPWKNPREHPKDNKDTLKKKIEVLEKQLKERNLMTKELEEELTIHRGGKKIELELKSDFEAIITKASGLHFMLDKVSTKMGTSGFISDKMATYIKETKLCIDKIYKRIGKMHEQVQAREERKSDLWAAMGVAKHHRTTVSDDYIPDLSYVDTGVTAPDIPYLNIDPGEMFSADSRLTPPPTSPSSATLSPQSSELSDSTLMVKSPSPGLSQDFFFAPVGSAESSTEYLGVPKKSGQGLSATGQQSVPKPGDSRQEVEVVPAVDLSQGRSSLVSGPTVYKRSWYLSEDEQGKHELKQKRVKSPRLQQSSGQYAHQPIVIGDDEEKEGPFLDNTRAPASAAYQLTSTVSSFDSQLERNSTSEAEVEAMQVSVGSKQRKRPPSEIHTVPMFQPLISPSSPASASSSFRSIWRSERSEIINLSSIVASTRKATFDETLPSLDLVEDIGDEDESSAESEMPTLRMYPLDTSGMDDLAYMTSHLSCEDISPSVTESIMTGELPAPFITRSPTTGLHKQHDRSVTTTASNLETRPSVKLVSVDVSLRRKTQTIVGGTERQQDPTFAVLQSDAMQQVPTSLTTVKLPERHVFQPLQQEPQVVVRPRLGPRSERSGGCSLSRAIGDLNAEFSLQK